MRAITLRIPSSGAHFSDTGRIPWSDTNLPANDFRFSEWTDIYWEVEMLAYNKHPAQLQVQATDFEAGEGGFPPMRRIRKPILLTDSPAGEIICLKGLPNEPPRKYSDKRWHTQ